MSNDVFLDIFKYPLAVLVQTPATYILMYCNASSTAFPAVRCLQFRKKVLELQQPCFEAQIELSSTFVYDQKMPTSGSSARNSHLIQGGRMTMMPMSVNPVSYTHLTLPTNREV